MTAPSTSLALLWQREPSTWLLVRMVQCTDDARRIADEIPPSDLKLDAWDRELFNAVAAMATAGRRVSPRNVYREIAGLPKTQIRAKVLERAADVGKLAVDHDCLFVIHETPLNDDIERYVEWSFRERFRELLSHAADMLKEGIWEPAIAQAAVEEGLANIRAKLDGAKAFDDINEQVERTLAYLRDPVVRGLPFGQPKLDDELMPLLYSHLVLIGGATGSGKSTIARNLYRHWTRDLKEHVALHTMEMSADEQLLNLACMELGADLEDVVKKRLSPKGLEAVYGAVEEWRDRPLRINDRSSVSPAGLLTTMRRYRSEGIRVQVVDHLHHLNYGAAGDKEKRIAIGNLARDLKTFAQDTDSVVLGLVQLVKKPVHVEPDESDIREAADIGESANQILMVYKPLVGCQREADGTFWPIRKTSGLPYYEGDKSMPKDAVLGFDRARVYVKPTKQRIRPKQGLFALPFNEKSGLIYSTEREP